MRTFNWRFIALYSLSPTVQISIAATLSDLITVATCVVATQKFRIVILVVDLLNVHTTCRAETMLLF